MQYSRWSNSCLVCKALGSVLRTPKTNKKLKTDLGFSSEACLLSMEVFSVVTRQSQGQCLPRLLSGRLMTRASEPRDSPGVTFLYKCKLCTCLLRQISTCLPFLCWAHRVPCSSRGPWKSAGLTVGSSVPTPSFSSACLGTLGVEHLPCCGENRPSAPLL